MKKQKKSNDQSMESILGKFIVLVLIGIIVLFLYVQNEHTAQANTTKYEPTVELVYGTPEVKVVLIEATPMPRNYDTNIAASATSPPSTNNRPKPSAVSQYFQTTGVWQWKDKIVEWSAGYPELDVNMIATIILIESNGNPNALSSTGACGLFQLWNRSDPTLCNDVEKNAHAGLAQLQSNVIAANGDFLAAAAGYNGGSKAREWFMGKLTREQYVEFLRTHESGNWSAPGVAEAKADQVERYVENARIYLTLP